MLLTFIQVKQAYSYMEHSHSNLAKTVFIKDILRGKYTPNIVATWIPMLPLWEEKDACVV